LPGYCSQIDGDGQLYLQMLPFQNLAVKRQWSGDSVTRLGSIAAKMEMPSRSITKGWMG